MLKKRGAQVTIFIILAILIIIIGVFLMHYKEIFIEEEEITPELVPIDNYVTNCIKNTAELGLQRIGETGGYIYLPDRIQTDPRSYLSIGPLLKIPYWWHDGINSVPTEEFITNQLERYINENLRPCVQEFETYQSQYKVKDFSDPKTTIKLNDDEVIINVDYPLNIFYNQGDSRLQLDTFKETVPIRLKKVIELAQTIMERENKDFFLEKKTIDLMTMNRNIPTTDIEATCDVRQWNLFDIKNRLKKLLSTNLPFIRILNADYNENSFVPTPSGPDTYENSYFQHHYIWEVSGESYKDISVSMKYDENWPFNIDARPRRGQLLQSNSLKGTDMLSWFCLHIWHFTYDISYPVKVTINDKPTSKHKDFSFNFAFKVSIDHNQPFRNSYTNQIFDTFEVDTNEEYCNDLYDEISIYTIADAIDDYDLDDVDLYFTCGPYTCPLGKSEYLSQGAAAGIRKELPYCVNAILRGSKEGFEDSEMFIQTDAENTYTLKLLPNKVFETYKVIKHPLVAPEDQLELKETETATISLSLDELKFDSYAFYPKRGTLELKLLADKEHEYEVNIFVMENNEIVGAYKTKWKVHPDLIMSSEQITFHVLDQGLVNDEERFEFLNNLEELSKQIPQPELE